ncbi:hypothetical protein [Acinetobacter phage pB23]|nr:hypothetical protein [Acinetobacter phage pB23]
MIRAPQAHINIELHQRQSDALFSQANEIMYGGAAGGGKSHLMRVLAIMFAMEIPKIQIYLFRRHYADLFKNHLEGAGSFYELLGPMIKTGQAVILESKNQIQFWNGSKIHLCHLQRAKDLTKYQGAEIHLLLMDELTHFHEHEYRYLRGRVRIGGLHVPPEYRGKIPMALSGTNPGGIGHSWVKRAFVDNAAPMQIKQMDKKEGGMRRQFIPALMSDNPTLMVNDPDYIDRLEGLGDPALVKAMKDGDWNIVAGGALDDVWSSKLILPRFKVPKGWNVDRSFDWGSSQPFSVGWWTEANGEEIEFMDGTTFAPPRGSLIRIAEWYGTELIGSNRGLKLSAKEIAEGINYREEAMLELGWIHSKPLIGVADSSIFDERESDVDSIAKKMEDEGVTWERANKSAGSRVNGLEIIRVRMKNVKKSEGAGIFFTENCRATITTLPILPRDEKKPEDVDTDAEDHVYDDIRYKVLQAGTRYLGELPFKTSY